MVWALFEKIVQCWLLLSDKLYAEGFWRTLNLCILSSVMSLQKSGHKAVGNGMYCPCPTHATRGKSPSWSLTLSLVELGMLVAEVCARAGSVGSPDAQEGHRDGWARTISSTWVLIFVENKMLLLRVTCKGTYV